MTVLDVERVQEQGSALATWRHAAVLAAQQQHASDGSVLTALRAAEPGYQPVSLIAPAFLAKRRVQAGQERCLAISIAAS